MVQLDKLDQSVCLSRYMVEMRKQRNEKNNALLP
jgi:hypothetical protein